jgi:hypothetical protein
LITTIRRDNMIKIITLAPFFCIGLFYFVGSLVRLKCLTEPPKLAYFPFIIKLGGKDALRIFHIIVGLIIMLSIVIAWLINPDIG